MPEARCDTPRISDFELRISCRLLGGFRSFARRGKWFRFWLGLFDEAESGIVEVVEFRLARLVAGELDEVATIEEFAEARFLVGGQEIGVTKFVQEFFRGTFGGMKVKAFFQVPANRVGDQDAEFAWLADESQGFLELMFGANVGRDRRDEGNLRFLVLPTAPGPESQERERYHDDATDDPCPGVGDVHRRLDVAQGIVRSAGN